MNDNEVTLEVFFNAFASSLSILTCKSSSSSGRVDQVTLSTRLLYRFKVYYPAPPFTFFHSKMYHLIKEQQF